MSLEIKVAANNIRLDNFSFNKDKGEIVAFNTRKPELQIILNVPFNLKKSKDILYDPSLDIDSILIFRNRYFKERSLITIKHKVLEKNKNVGFVFSLRGIMEADNIIN